MGIPRLCVRVSADLSTQPPTVKHRSSRRALWSVSALIVLLASVVAQAQNYTKFVIFGDSLSDNGNDALVFESTFGFPFPAPPYYTLGRFTDGPDTTPPAHRYFGVWVEQLAATLPAHPAVIPSLLGGTNYAYGFADTFDGTSLLNLTGTPYTIVVQNVGEQVEQYLATHPKIDNHTLFVVWGGANNITSAVGAPDAPVQIVDGALAQVGNIQRLIHAGATQFLIPNLPDLGAIPRFNMSPVDSAAFNDASVLYNTTLDTGVSLLPLLNFGRHLKLYKLDVYGLLKGVVRFPGSYGLLNVTDPSQFQPVDPDTYLFWDDLHPTTRGHNLLGQAALQLIEPRGCTLQVAPGEYIGVAAPGCR